MEERGADGSIHQKLSGFDGSYVIIRADVSALINKVPEAERDSSWLHVKQEGNADGFGAVRLKFFRQRRLKR